MRDESVRRRAGLSALGLTVAFATPGWADETPAASEHKTLNPKQVFATTCGWCHSEGARTEGKGPQLMNTKRSDEFIRNRIIYGKEGRMPSFGASFSLEDIDAIIAYIRALKPD